MTRWSLHHTKLDEKMSKHYILGTAIAFLMGTGVSSVTSVAEVAAPTSNDVYAESSGVRELLTAPHAPCTHGSRVSSFMASCTAEKPCQISYKINIDMNGDVQCATTVGAVPEVIKALFNRSASRVMFSAKFAPSNSVTVGQNFTFKITNDQNYKSCTPTKMERYVPPCK
jgi:hypothetical protein